MDIAGFRVQTVSHGNLVVVTHMEELEREREMHPVVPKADIPAEARAEEKAARAITAGKNALTKILITAVADQVDVIACDANMFTNRNFRSDRHSDPATGAALTILDQILVSANKRREPSKRITYNWGVSTLATEQLAALEGQDADCDCLSQIAVNYGKDVRALWKRSSDITEDHGRVGYEGPPQQKETTIKTNESLKHLNHLDFCLKSSDEGYHHPFQCNFSL